MRWTTFYFSFEGRVPRGEYLKYCFIPWWFIVLATVVLADPIWFGEALLFVYALLFWPSIAVGAKRCHDRNRSGWFQLISLVTLFGPIWLNIELAFFPGTKGDNLFGADPFKS